MRVKLFFIFVLFLSFKSFSRDYQIYNNYKPIIQYYNPAALPFQTPFFIFRSSESGHLEKDQMLSSYDKHVFLQQLSIQKNTTLHSATSILNMVLDTPLEAIPRDFIYSFQLVYKGYFIHNNVATLFNLGYLFPISDTQTISLGSKFSLSFESINFSTLTDIHKEQVLPSDSLKYAIDIGMGIYYKAHQFSLGISAPQIINFDKELPIFLTASFSIPIEESLLNINSIIMLKASSLGYLVGLDYSILNYILTINLKDNSIYFGGGYSFPSGFTVAFGFEAFLKSNFDMETFVALDTY